MIQSSTPESASPSADLLVDASVEISVDLARLILDIQPLAPSATIAQAADLLLQPVHARMLCLPVVAEGKIVGSLSRHTLNSVFMHRFGRELYGSRPVSSLMNQSPLRVDHSSSLEAAARHVSANLGSPITEDFVVVDGDRYLGMGVVMDLLSAMQARVEASSAELAGAYARLKSSQAQLVQSEKMASLGQMVAGVAHEINTPLGYVRNNVEMIADIFQQMSAALAGQQALLTVLRDADADAARIQAQMDTAAEALRAFTDPAMIEDANQLIGDSLHGVDTIHDLVVNLRNFSRLDQSRVSAVSVNDCLDQTLSIAANVLKHRVEVIKNYGPVPAIRCSPSQINQVLLNLMTNAAQAIEHDHGKLLLRTEADDHWVRIHVEDNGKGIASEHLQRIFDPFFTTKPVGHGTGLGLSISYQIIEAHGGQIQVKSEPGRGTKFLVHLPRQPAAQSAVDTIVD